MNKLSILSFLLLSNITLAQTVQPTVPIVNTGTGAPVTVSPSGALQPQLSENTKQFVTALKQCQPGTYQYAMPGAMGMVTFNTVISGMENGLCLTETKYNMGNFGDVVIKCAYAPQEIQNINVQSMQIKSLSDYSTVDPAIGALFTKNCQVNSTGMLQKLQEYRTQQNQLQQNQ